jgi:hypothetical protein
VRGVRDRVLVRAQGAVVAYPENPRDADDRVLCPICKCPIDESEPTSTGGVYMYHRACWRPRGGIGEVPT